MAISKHHWSLSAKVRADRTVSNVCINEPRTASALWSIVDRGCVVCSPAVRDQASAAGIPPSYAGDHVALAEDIVAALAVSEENRGCRLSVLALIHSVASHPTVAG
jgi:hypothetical protein